MSPLVLALALVFPLEPEVDAGSDTPEVIVKNRVWRPSDPSPVADLSTPINDGDAPEPRLPEPILYICRPEAPGSLEDRCVREDQPDDTADTLTPARIEREVRRIGLPPRHLTIQPPDGQTLVNLDTIFHTTAPALRRTITVLNTTIDLRARPHTYTWNHGDGTTQTTDHPGNPYPHHTITHTYHQPGTVHPSLDIAYQIHYRINNGPWQNLPTTITAPGPTTPLRIRQARPVLEHSR